MIQPQENNFPKKDEEVEWVDSENQVDVEHQAELTRRVEKIELAEKERRALVLQLRQIALDFVGEEEQEFVIEALKGAQYIDGIVNTLRHVEGGQVYILKELKKLNPEMMWYRGGTLSKWRDKITPISEQYFTEEELETYVLDGGANGAFGRKSLAEGFLRTTKREIPVIYELSLDALIEGLENGQIKLVAEHNYDSRVLSNDDHKAFLKFCKEHLKIESKSGV